MVNVGSDHNKFIFLCVSGTLGLTLELIAIAWDRKGAGFESDMTCFLYKQAIFRFEKKCRLPFCLIMFFRSVATS